MAFVSVSPGALIRPRGKLASARRRRPQNEVTMVIDRRTCLQRMAGGALVLCLPSLQSVDAAMYSADTKTDSFAPKGDLSKIEAYMPQIEAGYEAMRNLSNEWEAKTRDYDGDVVRRVLGTVGVTSPLFNIRKSFLKAWQLVAEKSTDDELIERLETEWNDVLNGISSVDFQLYSVSFTELIESKESLILQGKKALDNTITIYADMLKDFRSTI